jgi:DNA invertase Pin-like site-specific DNA recombinase/ribosomal protein L32E
MATAYSYIRRVHGELDDSEAAVEEMEKAAAYFRDSLQKDSLDWGGHFIDGSDARTLPLPERPEGRRLWRRLESGDHIIIPRFDRGFLNMPDFLFCYRHWAGKRVGVSLLDVELLDIDERHLGALEILGKMADADAVRRSESLRQGRVTRQATERAAGGSAGLGFKFEGPKGRLRKVPDPDERKVMAQIVQLRDEGNSWNEIASLLMRQRIRRGKFDWHPGTIARAYKAEWELRTAEQPGAMKRCYACGRYKRLTQEHFHKNASETDGYHRICKPCRGAHRKEIRKQKRKQRRTVAVDAFQQAACKGKQPSGACGQIAQEMGGADKLAEQFLAVYKEAKPGSRKRVGMLKAAMRLAIQASGARADETELPGDGT